MSYPNQPWKLNGFAIQTLQLMRSDLAQKIIPKELNPVSIVRKKTLCGIYLASYTNGSDLEYSELILVKALASSRGKFGFWLSHLFVDNPDSMEGGRKIWGLPKELASFDWQVDSVGRKIVKITQKNSLLCQISWSDRFRVKMPVKFDVPFLSFTSRGLAHSKMGIAAFAGAVSVAVQVPQESPLYDEIISGEKLTGVKYDGLKLKAKFPGVLQ